MRTVLIVVVLASFGTATANDRSWDGTYAEESRSGNELCPYNAGEVVVKDGSFSIVWNVRTGDDRAWRVGTITGTVRPSGFVTVRPKLDAPMATESLAQVKKMGDTVEMLQDIANKMRMQFHSRSKLTIELHGGPCGARWEGRASTAKATSSSSVRPIIATDPGVKPPAPLSAGSASWDTTYDQSSSFSNDWRCPKAVEQLTVKNGRFSMPLTLDARNALGQEFGRITIGSLDGSIAAGGKVTLRHAFSVRAMPPEIAAGWEDKATLDEVRALAGTMTFSKSGGERTAKLVFGKACEYSFESTGTYAKKRARAKYPSPKKETKKAKEPEKEEENNSGAPCRFHDECTSYSCRDEVCD